MPIITFKYKDTIISTPNLEKKLKRMKLSLNDIEIIDTPTNKKEELIEEPSNLQKIIIQSSLYMMLYLYFFPVIVIGFHKSFLINSSIGGKLKSRGTKDIYCILSRED